MYGEKCDVMDKLSHRNCKNELPSRSLVKALNIERCKDSCVNVGIYLLVD